MGDKHEGILKGRELFSFCLMTVIILVIAALILETPKGLFFGMLKIILSRDALITDYFELAGYGTAFLNAGLVMGLGW